MSTISHNPADLACSQPADLRTARFDMDARCPICRGEQTEALSEARQRLDAARAAALRPADGQSNEWALVDLDDAKEAVARAEREALRDAEAEQSVHAACCNRLIFTRTKRNRCRMPRFHTGLCGYLRSNGWALDGSAGMNPEAS